MFKLSLRTKESCAKDLAERFGCWEEFGPPAVSVFESTDGHWDLAAYFESVPDELTLREFVRDYSDQHEIGAFSYEPLEDRDWVSASQAGLHPVIAGRYVVFGSHDRDAFRAHPYGIEVDAGQAFGTAHHGTTRGCLIAIDLLARRLRPSRILDLGTGSGILSIAAARVFRRSLIIGSDADPIAVDVARSNCRINGTQRVRLRVANGLADPLIRRKTPFDLIVANILAGPLGELAPSIGCAQRLGDYLILSGLLDAQAASVRARYRCFGYVAIRTISLEGWATLVLRRRA